jgi:hypothetical protein
MKVKKFHQFVVLEKGPVNTAIIDLLKGNIYQIGNDIIFNFLDGNNQEIGEFIHELEEEEEMGTVKEMLVFFLMRCIRVGRLLPVAGVRGVGAGQSVETDVIYK